MEEGLRFWGTSNARLQHTAYAGLVSRSVYSIYTMQLHITHTHTTSLTGTLYILLGMLSCCPAVLLSCIPIDLIVYSNSEGDLRQSRLLVVCLSSR